MENVVESQESDSDDEPLIKLAKRSSSQQSLASKVSSSTTSNSSDSTDVEEKPCPSSTSGKPLTAFAHFFNDTQHTIRSKNSAVTFEEVSQIVMSMWQSLEASDKLPYQKREEDDRIRFENAMPSLVPKLVAKVDPQADTSTGQIADQMDTDQTSTPTSQPEATPDNIVKEEGTKAVTKTPPPSLSRPVIIGNMPRQRQVITLSQSNKIIVRTKPVSPTPAPASDDVKTTAIVGKATGDAPAVDTPPISSPTNYVKANNGSEVECSSPEDRISPTQSKCKHSGCEKPASQHDKWDDYCSSKCLVEDCHERFKAWVRAREIT